MKRYGAAPAPRRQAETWAVIYIDLITNMMVFFVLLWAINSRAPKGVDDSVGDQTVKMVNLPGDVLFSPGKADLTTDGRQVFGKLFADETGTVLSFDATGVSRRLLVIHGHTDNDGDKEHNFELGYQRALTAYREIKKYGGELAEHAVICTHADNSPAQEVPSFVGVLTPAETSAVREAKSKNRRITIEDKIESTMKKDGE
jgi:flagellar motor protein MotB